MGGLVNEIFLLIAGAAIALFSTWVKSWIDREAQCSNEMFKQRISCMNQIWSSFYEVKNIFGSKVALGHEKWLAQNHAEALEKLNAFRRLIDENQMSLSKEIVSGFRELDTYLWNKVAEDNVLKITFCDSRVQKWFQLETIVMGTTVMGIDDKSNAIIYAVVNIDKDSKTVSYSIYNNSISFQGWIFYNQNKQVKAQTVSQGGLTWMRIDPKGNAWPEANAYCNNTTINGQTGWRLPTKDELKSLYDSGAMNGQGWTLAYTWSSTPGSAGGHDNVGLHNGGVGANNDTGSNYVTCVR